MPDAVLRVSRIRRTFGRERVVAVDDVSFSISAGQILCLLGPNGAGKTTTVSMCSTVLAPTSGEISVAGVDAVAEPRAARRHIGLVLGGDRGFYQRASARDNLLFFADVSGVPRTQRSSRVDDALEAVSLSSRAGDPVRELSRGMTQRLHIARALLGRPALLLLDEPTNGLDPEIARDVRALVRSLASTGTAVLLTTHYMTEAEMLADRLLVIIGGVVASEGTVADVVATSGVSTVSTSSTDVVPRVLADDLMRSGATGPVSTEVRDGRTHLRVPWTHEPQLDLLSALLLEHTGGVPTDLVTRPATLEESYLALVQSRTVS